MLNTVIQPPHSRVCIISGGFYSLEIIIIIIMCVHVPIDTRELICVMASVEKSEDNFQV